MNEAMDRYWFAVLSARASDAATALPIKDRLDVKKSVSPVSTM